LSAMVGLDGVPMHFQLFPKLWIDIYNTKQIDRKFIMMLVTSHGFLEYVDAVLLDERPSLNNSHVFNFLLIFFPKVCDQVLTDQVQNIISHLVGNFIQSADSFTLTATNTLKQLNGDLRALILVSSTRGELLTIALMEALKTLKARVESLKLKEEEKSVEKTVGNSSAESGATKNSPPPTKVSKPNDESAFKNKWKDSLIMFLHTLNLLIGMCENALNTKEETKTEESDGKDEKAAENDEKCEKADNLETAEKEESVKKESDSTEKPEEKS